MTSIATAHAALGSHSYVSDYDAIVETMNRYNDGVRTGVSASMKPSFHDKCTFYGDLDGQLLGGRSRCCLTGWTGMGPRVPCRFVSPASTSSTPSQWSGWRWRT